MSIDPEDHKGEPNKVAAVEKVVASPEPAQVAASKMACEAPVTQRATLESPAANPGPTRSAYSNFATRRAANVPDSGFLMAYPDAADVMRAYNGFPMAVRNPYYFNCGTGTPFVYTSIDPRFATLAGQGLGLMAAVPGARTTVRRSALHVEIAKSISAVKQGELAPMPMPEIQYR